MTELFVRKTNFVGLRSMADGVQFEDLKLKKIKFQVKFQKPWNKIFQVVQLEGMVLLYFDHRHNNLAQPNGNNKNIKT